MLLARVTSSRSERCYTFTSLLATSLITAKISLVLKFSRSRPLEQQDPLNKVLSAQIPGVVSQFLKVCDALSTLIYGGLVTAKWICVQVFRGRLVSVKLVLSMHLMFSFHAVKRCFALTSPFLPRLSDCPQLELTLCSFSALKIVQYFSQVLFVHGVLIEFSWQFVGLRIVIVSDLWSCKPALQTN